MNRTISLYVSMALAGIAGYLTLWFAVRTLTPQDYATFGAFWAGLYFAVGSLAGLQQEVTRAATPAGEHQDLGSEPPKYETSFIRLGLISIGALLVLAILCSLLLGNVLPASLPILSVMILPLVIALCGYALVSIFAGALYGVQRWSLIAGLIFADSALRLGFVIVVLWQGGQLSDLYWAVSLPFPLALVLLLPWIVPSLRSQVRSDVRLAKLSLNSLQAIGAAMGMALLMSGLPLLVSVTTSQEPVGPVSHAMFAITVARAPFIVVAVSLQSLILVRFKSRSDTSSLMKKISLYFVFAASVCLVLSLWLGRPVLDLLLGTEAKISALLVSAIVLAGIAVAFMIITGVAVLSRSLHGAYISGWVIAAVGTVVALALPAPFETRVIVALFVGPMLGIAIHLLALRYFSRRV